LKLALKWLCLAQDHTSDGGVSEGYHLYHGWLPAYPETTGYIIETFLDYYHQTKEATFKRRACRMADWLISIQNRDGSIPDSYLKSKMVFDTGQVIFGLVRCYQETKDDKYKQAAINAGNWLINTQEKDGSWKRFALHQIPHTYYTRVAWSLLVLHSITKQLKYIEAGIKNIEWALSQQTENGWFNCASFTLKNHNTPFTHTIAYTIRGILEAGLYLEEDKYISRATKSVDNLLDHIPHSGVIPGTYDKNWRGDKTFSCLTGNAQLATILFKLEKLKGSQTYFPTTISINNYLKRCQDIFTTNLNIRGAIAGSSPIWGGYMHFVYPNWASKFFADSLMLEGGLNSR
jgi:rhamnogalacturonyl hydrolase YesR